MLLGIILAIGVAIIWALGEVTYSKVSKKYDRANVYMYTYLLRANLYILAVVLFASGMIGEFNTDVFLALAPIIFCDFLASYVVNIAVFNGKLTVVSPIMAAYPVLDVALGAILLNEGIGTFQYVLVGIICLSIVFLAMSQKKSKKAPHPIKGIIFAIVYMLLVAFSTYFEKSVYVNNFSIFDLYYYKGLVYTVVSLVFGLIIFVTPTKVKPPKLDIIKGCGLTPIGNILYSCALSVGSLTIVAPISSLYSVITNLISRIVLKEKISIKERIFIALILISTFLLILFGLVL